MPWGIPASAEREQQRPSTSALVHRLRREPGDDIVAHPPLDGIVQTGEGRPGSHEARRDDGRGWEHVLKTQRASLVP